jgi:acyl-CoA synthetase (AMP-forming)/AMP-acid ligase II
MPRFSPAEVLEAFAEGASVMSAVPQMYAAILRHLKAEGAPPVAPRLRYISAGGAPLDPEWKHRIEEAFGLPLNNGYGLTETAPGVSGTWQAAPRSDTSVGYALPDVELRIDQPDKDGVGELWIRGPGIMKGYYRDPGRSAEVLPGGGWFRSGDLARIDADGALFIVGRLKELIIRSGFNVHPPEVEAMLTRHPAISQAAVVGRMLPGNEEILAFCLSDGSVGEAELKDWLRGHLTHYKVPQHILFVDHYPIAATGKILKHKLVEHFAPLLAERDTAAART